MKSQSNNKMVKVINVKQENLTQTKIKNMKTIHRATLDSYKLD